MARPRSEDKQLALLRAATEIIAAQGLVASTSSIAKLAGVAEGTLFRYFATKDVLLQAVFGHLMAELAAELTRGFDSAASLKERTRSMWDNYIDWGISYPAAYSTLNQLIVSGKLPAEQLEVASQLCMDVGCSPEELQFNGMTPEQSSQFSEGVLTAVANATVSFVAIHPEMAPIYKSAGFAMLWRAIYGNDG